MFPLERERERPEGRRKGEREKKQKGLDMKRETKGE
jgi:hypothetical protein